MSEVEKRTRLAARQSELVRALVGGGEPPAGFDADRLRVAARSLANKRSQAVARVWPEFPHALGTHFESRFAAFAAETSLPEVGGPQADGRAFAAWLARRGPLPDTLAMGVLAVDLRYRRSARGLTPRRGPTLRAAVLRQARRLVLAVQVPGWGVGAVRLWLPPGTLWLAGKDRTPETPGENQ